MKNIIFILSLFVVSLSNATNFGEVETNNQIYILSEKVERVIVGIGNDEALSCQTSTTSTVTTNQDGSSTRTTTTTISCDTPQELAQLHALMAAIGMGV